MAKKDVTKDSVFKDEKTITYGENEDQITDGPDGLDDETGLTREQFEAAKTALDADAGDTSVGDTSVGDTSVGDTSVGTGDEEPKAEKRVRNGKKVGTGGSVQGANLQTVTTVGAFVDDASVLHKNTIPQENDDKMVNRYLQRGLQNGDIRSKDDSKSLYAERMVNEGKQFQHSKAVVKPFPATGAAYLALLKQQGQFNTGSENTPAGSTEG